MHTTPSPRCFSFRRLCAAPVLGFALVAAAGCGTSVDHTEAAAAPGQTAQAEHGSPSHGLLLGALDQVPLRPDQQTKVAAIREGLEAQAGPVHAARAQLGAELAQEVRAGKIDQGRLQPLVDQLAAAAARTKPAAQQAVQQLHDALDASQRQAFVGALRGEARSGFTPGALRGRLEKLTADLNLSDEQRATLRTQVRGAFAGRAETMQAEHGAAKAHLDAIATAFPGESFDARALDVGEHVLGNAGRLASVTSTFLEAAVPVLTAAQRETLAAKILNRTEVAGE